MTEYDYSPDAPSLLSLYDGPHPSRLRCWLPVDRINRRVVRGIAPETGPADSELFSRTRRRISGGSDSLLELLEKIYQHYDGTSISLLRMIMHPEPQRTAGHCDALFRVSSGLLEEEASRLKRILQRYEGGSRALSNATRFTSM